MEPETQKPGSPHRMAAMVGTIAIAVALVGFFTGLRDPLRIVRPGGESFTLGHREDNVPVAVSYTELPEAGLSPNDQWESNLQTLISPRPDVRAPVVRTEAMKLEALADRASRRAFDGAPPVIPHPINSQYASMSCLACHRQGLWVGDRLATPMSHPELTNCTQCHVEAVGPEFTAGFEPVENEFVGVYRAGSGGRAGPGAPPTIPHSTWMRQECLSCHGLVARPGLRTTHPWLTNCTQCHASSAVLDQAAFVESLETMP